MLIEHKQKTKKRKTTSKGTSTFGLSNGNWKVVNKSKKKNNKHIKATIGHLKSIIEIKEHALTHTHTHVYTRRRRSKKRIEISMAVNFEQKAPFERSIQRITNEMWNRRHKRSTHLLLLSWKSDAD